MLWRRKWPAAVSKEDSRTARTFVPCRQYSRSIARRNIDLYSTGMRDDLTGQSIKRSMPLGLPEFYGAPQAACALSENGGGARVRSESPSTTLALPQNKKITLSVVSGPSSGRMVEISTPRISIGRAGGGADIQLDDPNVSDLHCALGVTPHEIRLCDLESKNGTYLNEERVESAELEHMSEFRVGSSHLLLIVVPKLK